MRIVPTRGDDIVASWKQRLPIIKVLEGDEPGRSIKPLRDKVDNLSGNPTTAADAQRLSLFLSTAVLAQQLRKDRIHKLPESQLEVAVKALLREKIALPEPTKLLLVEERMRLLQAQSDLEALLIVAKPWAPADETFQSLEPKLGVLNMALSTRISKFRKSVWDGGFAPLLMSGDASKDKVLQGCAALQTHFASEDIVMLDGPAAIVCKDSLVAATAIKAIQTMAGEPEDMDAIEKIASRTGRTDKGILNTVANTIEANPILKEKLATMILARPAVEEYSEQLNSFGKSLDGMPDDTVLRLGLLKDMCRHLSLVRSTSAAFWWDAFADRLFGELLRSWSGLSSKLDAGQAQVSTPLLNALQGFAAEATTAFSLDERVATMQGSIAVLLSSQSQKVRIDTLRSAASHPTIIDLSDHLTCAPVLQQLQEALTECGGMHLDSGMINILGNAAMKIANNVMAHIGTDDTTIQRDINIALDLWQMMCGLSTLPRAGATSLKGARCAVKMHNASALAAKMVADETLGWSARLHARTWRMHRAGHDDRHRDGHRR